MATVNDTSDLTCPRCGEALLSPAGMAMDVQATDDDQLRISAECPACDAPVAIIVDAAISGDVASNVWVEDRRDDTPKG